MVDEQEDDWAPLTEEQLAMRPGEVEDAPFVGEFARVAEKVAEPEVEEPLEPPPKKPVDPRAEQMMRELEERVAKAGRGDSLISQVQRREHRTARKQKAKARVAPQLAAMCVVGEAPPEPEPEFEIAKKSDVDPRELETWFQELPEDERERLRESWSSERHRFDHTGKVWRRRMKRAAIYGSICFVTTGMLMSYLFMDLNYLWRFALVGPIAGCVAQLCGGERFTYGLVGAIGFIAAIGSAIAIPFSWYGLLFAITTMCAMGLDGEMRRTGGCTDE